MSYMMRGYVFHEGEACRLIDGKLLVNNWDEALELLKNANYEHYIITLDKIPGVKEE